MTIHIDTSGLDRFGWMRIDGVVPVGLCERLVEILEAERSRTLDQSLTGRKLANPYLPESTRSETALIFKCGFYRFMGSPMR
jgi:hypothetical protein